MLLYVDFNALLSFFLMVLVAWLVPPVILIGCGFYWRKRDRKQADGLFIAALVYFLFGLGAIVRY